jgi:hypothetical protein
LRNKEQILNPNKKPRHFVFRVETPNANLPVCGDYSAVHFTRKLRNVTCKECIQKLLFLQTANYNAAKRFVDGYTFKPSVQPDEEKINRFIKKSQNLEPLTEAEEAEAQEHMYAKQQLGLLNIPHRDDIVELCILGDEATFNDLRKQVNLLDDEGKAIKETRDFLQERLNDLASIRGNN